MKLTGRLRNPEFLCCIDYDGRVNATVDNAEVQELVKQGLNTQVNIRLNPEVRLEPVPQHMENIIVASSDLVSE